MKRFTIFLLILPIFSIFNFIDIGSYNSYTNTYFIYVKPEDQMLNKIYYKNTIGITYGCSCYARNDALRFRCEDTSKSYIKRKLPPKTYSMLEFAGVANNMRNTFKNHELWFSEIYMVEQIGRHKYHYYKVQFYPIEGDE